MNLYQLLSGGMSAEEHRISAKEQAEYQRDNPPDPHDTLTSLGLIEGPIGSSANLLNSTLYALEGKGKESLWELTGAVPFLGAYTQYFKALEMNTGLIDDALRFFRDKIPSSRAIPSLNKTKQKAHQYITVDRPAMTVDKLYKKKITNKQKKQIEASLEKRDKRVLRDVEKDIDRVIDESGVGPEGHVIQEMKSKKGIGEAYDEVAEGVSDRIKEDMGIVGQERVDIFQELGQQKRHLGQLD
mgnify:CR=1 FL=1